VIRVFSDEDALAQALAAQMLDDIRRAPSLVLGLPTGRTPLALYRRLAARSHEADWTRVRTFNLDEFVGLGGDLPGSYRTFMEAALFANVDIPPDRRGFLDGRAADLDQECRRYEAAIAAAGGIDLLVLGIGGNGHIGFNEPGAALAARTHRATLEPETQAANAWLFAGDVSRVPAEALTMGMATILQARAIALVATGPGKAGVVRRAFEEPVTTWLPASFLQLHPRVSVWLDQDAARSLDGPEC
jgi:glucosamine-6-phosphate deaminase